MMEQKKALASTTRQRGLLYRQIVECMPAFARQNIFAIFQSVIKKGTKKIKLALRHMFFGQRVSDGHLPRSVK